MYIHTYLCIFHSYPYAQLYIHMYVCIIARINSVIIAGNRSRFVCPFISGWSIVIALANRVAIANRNSETRVECPPNRKHLLVQKLAEHGEKTGGHFSCYGIIIYLCIYPRTDGLLMYRLYYLIMPNKLLKTKTSNAIFHWPSHFLQVQG